MNSTTRRAEIKSKRREMSVLWNNVLEGDGAHAAERESWKIRWCEQ